MKKICLLFLCVLLIAGLAGCASETPSETTTETRPPLREQVVCPLTVMIDGQEYRDWSFQRPHITIEEDQILGYITSVVSIATMPTKDDEANYASVLNAPYARWVDEEYGEVYVIKRIDNCWYILLPADYPIGE